MERCASFPLIHLIYRLILQLYIVSTQFLEPNGVALLSSRGYETKSHKLIMRSFVVLIDCLIWFPAVALFVAHFYSQKNGWEKVRLPAKQIRSPRYSSSSSSSSLSCSLQTNRHFYWSIMVTSNSTRSALGWLFGRQYSFFKVATFWPALPSRCP